MKNYYEILEVSQSASSEVIEKAYKALVKKYHPDLQPEDKKQFAENKIKEINEAYDILSNTEKRANYDQTLNYNQKIEEEKKYNEVHSSQLRKSDESQFGAQSRPLQNDGAQSSQIRNHSQSGPIRDDEYNKKINEAYHNAYANAYNDAYINTLRSMGVKIKYKRTFKEKVRYFCSVIFTICFIILFCFICWHIPPIRRYLVNLYNTNEIVRLFVNIIKSLLNSVFDMFK